MTSRVQRELRRCSTLPFWCPLLNSSPPATHCTYLRCEVRCQSAGGKSKAGQVSQVTASVPEIGAQWARGPGSAEREGNAVKGAGGSRLDSKDKDVSRPRRSYFTPSGSSYRGFCELFRIPVILGLDKHESKEYSWL